MRSLPFPYPPKSHRVPLGTRNKDFFVAIVLASLNCAKSRTRLRSSCRKSVGNFRTPSCITPRRLSYPPTLAHTRFGRMAMPQANAPRLRRSFARKYKHLEPNTVHFLARENLLATSFGADERTNQNRFTGKTCPGTRG
jgi:hypothetical protein